MGGTVIPIILEKGRGFPGAGASPIFRPFMAGLRTVMVRVDESFN